MSESEPTIFKIKPRRRGWQCFAAPGVAPYFTESDARQRAIRYARGRTAGRAGEIRVFDAAGKLEQVIAFDERSDPQRV